MTRASRGRSNIGCGTVIAAVVALSILAAIIGAVARAYTDFAVWVRFGARGLDPLESRSVAYPLAWGLFLASLLVVGAAGAAAAYEFRSRRRFREYVGTLKSPR